MGFDFEFFHSAYTLKQSCHENDDEQVTLSFGLDIPVKQKRAAGHSWSLLVTPLVLTYSVKLNSWTLI
ncbi:hypothetical protein AGMB00912_00323 [Lactiplantibacillus argentoratensis]